MLKPLLSAGLLVLLVAQVLLSAPGNIQVPFAGTVFYELSAESLTFDGQMHVTTQVTPKGSVSIRANLDDVSATGEITGTRYIAIGSDGVTVPFATSVSEELDFQIIPASGTILSCILRVRLGLTFSTSGQLTNVVIENMEVVHF